MIQDFKEATLAVLRNNGYLPAIKYLKENSGIGLAMSKEAVDQWRMEQGLNGIPSIVETLEAKNKSLTEALQKWIDFTDVHIRQIKPGVSVSDVDAWVEAYRSAKEALKENNPI